MKRVTTIYEESCELLIVTSRALRQRTSQSIMFTCQVLKINPLLSSTSAKFSLLRARRARGRRKVRNTEARKMQTKRSRETNNRERQKRKREHEEEKEV